MGMESSDLSDLSSVSSTLDDMTARIEAIARRYEDSPREDLAARLREVERSLGSAVRRLEALLRAER